MLTPSQFCDAKRTFRHSWLFRSKDRRRAIYVASALGVFRLPSKRVFLWPGQRALFAVRNRCTFSICQGWAILTKCKLFRLQWSSRLRFFLQLDRTNLCASAPCILGLPASRIALIPRPGALTAPFNQRAILLRRCMAIYTPLQIWRQQRPIRVISGGVDNHLASAHSFVRFPCQGVVLVPGPCALGASIDLSALSECEVRAVFTPFNVWHVGNGRGQGGWLVPVCASAGRLSAPVLGIWREPLIWILFRPGP